MKKQMRYSPEVRGRAVRLLRKHQGEYASEWAAGVPLRSSQAIAPAALSNVSSLSVSERQELMELRKKLKRVEMERDILAKATAWFANNKD